MGADRKSRPAPQHRHTHTHTLILLREGPTGHVWAGAGGCAFQVGEGAESRPPWASESPDRPWAERESLSYHAAFPAIRVCSLAQGQVPAGPQAVLASGDGSAGLPGVTSLSLWSSQWFCTRHWADLGAEVGASSNPARAEVGSGRASPQRWAAPSPPRSEVLPAPRAFLLALPGWPARRAPCSP